MRSARYVVRGPYDSTVMRPVAAFLRIVIAVACLCAVAAAQDAMCEPWCSEPCAELNGNVQIECGACTKDKNRCYPGASGYESWGERNDAFHSSADQELMAYAMDAQNAEPMIAPGCQTLRCKRVRQKRRMQAQKERLALESS